MKPDERSVEEVLHHALPSAPRAQMEAALDRVFMRLRMDDQIAVDEPEAEKSPGLPDSGWWRPAFAAMAVTAAVAIAVWPGADIALYRVVDGTVQSGDTIRTSGAGAMLALPDGSRVEMRSRSELALERADDGIGIRLNTGSIIVNAAEQGAGHLYVQTKDMTVSVVGTVFVVNAQGDGSRVAVIEGEVRVREAKVETRLRPGEQVSTSPTLAARPVNEAVAWSRHADAHLAILASFAKGMAATAAPLTSSTDRAGSVNASPDQAGSAQVVQGFEEASIRECDPDNLPPTPPGARGGGANSFQMTPGRTHALCLTLATLIRTAYGYGPAELDFATESGRGLGMNFGAVYGLGVEDGLRVKGGPDWVRSQPYTIDAVADGAANAETMRGPMLRALLEQRFGLKTHIETEQVPAFALTVAPGGPKIKPVASGACEPLQARPGSPLLYGYPLNVLTPPRKVADVRRGEKPSCGLWGHRNGPNWVSLGGDVPFDAITGFLGFRLGARRVFDKTGLTDRFNFVLEFVLDENTPGPGVPGAVLPAPPQPADVPPAATIFVALEEQLGLRLEPARAPREFIVIDQVERPSPN
jgi:uncharacterized protein (TIGR03435 family)